MKHKKPYKNLTGQKFGRLTVLAVAPTEAKAKYKTKWICKCDCGNEVIVQGDNLKHGNTQSCGCLQKEKAHNRQLKHGDTGSRLYISWQHMLRRCDKETDAAYKYYGGRGISVCEEWHDYTAFRKWSLANGYADNLTIDRINVDGNYCPENCRWITHQEQQKNKRNNIFVTFNNETKTICDWAREFGCNSSAVYRTILEREGRISNVFNKQ